MLGFHGISVAPISALTVAAPAIIKTPRNGLILIAALAAAWSIAPDNGYIGGRAPYEPRRLSPALLNVRVDNPVSQYSPALQSIIAAWPAIPDPLPQTTIKRVPGSVDFPPRGRPVDRMLKQAGNWVIDTVPEYPPKLIQGRIDFIRRQNLIPAAVIESWFAPQQYFQKQFKSVPPTAIIVSVQPPFTRGWLATVRVSWEVTEARTQRAPYLVTPSFVPPVVVTDCGHLYPSNYKYADLTEAFYTAGILTEAISAAGSQRSAISKSGSTRSSASKAGSMKPEIPC